MLSQRFSNLIESFRERLALVTRRSGAPSVLSLETGLLAISKVYGGVMCLRRQFYECGVLPSSALPCHVISIGNIVAGGTGKTPMTVFVARQLSDMGMRVAVVSRGYRGTMEVGGGIVSDGGTIYKGPDAAGDEPYLMARLLPGVPVLVGQNRHQSGNLAVERFDSQVIVLDDAFQHLCLQRDMDIVLLDSQSPLGNGHLLPRGVLREPPSALRRARAIVYTRSSRAFASTPMDHWSIMKPTFYASHLQVTCLPKQGNDPFIRHFEDLSILEGKHVTAFAGLADTAQFFDSLKRAGCKLDKTIAFDDHHTYSRADLDRIASTAKGGHADCLVTTLKDYVKFESYTHWPMALVVVDVTIQLRDRGDLFRRLLVESSIKKIKT